MHSDFAWAIDSICARIKFSANTTTRSVWCSRKLATIPWWRIMRKMWPKIRQPTQKATTCSHRIQHRTICWPWSRLRRRQRLRPINSNNNKNYSSNTMIWTTTATVHRLAPVAVFPHRHSIHRIWKYRIAPERWMVSNSIFWRIGGKYWIYMKKKNSNQNRIA